MHVSFKESRFVQEKISKNKRKNIKFRKINREIGKVGHMYSILKVVYECYSFYEYGNIIFYFSKAVVFAYICAHYSPRHIHSKNIKI